MQAGPPVERRIWTFAGIAPPLIAAALFLVFLSFLPTVSSGADLRFAWDWVPSLGVQSSFLVDGLSLTFALLISGIGVVVMLYSASYLAGHPQRGRFSLYLTAFMFSMLGLVLSDNLLNLFVFWELTTITSYLLIGFSHDDDASRRSALQALLVTGAGGLAMLAGFILIGSEAGSYELSEIRAAGDILRQSPIYLPILILILAGAFTKSAQVPFHFWLPNAMAAPTPVSAYLHSATMVKGGVYLLARLHPSLSGTSEWLWSLTVVGGATAVFASVVAIRQTDLKQTLAYTTLMALGTLVMLLGSPSGYAITAMAAFLVVHSLYKAPLFLVVGCIDHETGLRDAGRLGGLGRKMPVTAVTAALAGLSMAGIAPFLGFIAKELMYAAGLESPASRVFVTGAIFAASSLMAAAAAIVALRPFWGGSDRLPAGSEPQGEAHWAMIAGPLVLAMLGLGFGVFPHVAQTHATTPIVAALSGDPAQAKELHLWAGFNLPLMLSVLTLIAGLILYVLHQPLRAALARAEAILPSFDRGWDGLLDGMMQLARWQTSILQSGVLKRYLVTIFLALLAGLSATLIRGGLQIGDFSPPQQHVIHYAVFALTTAGTLLAVYTRSRITAIASLGVVGIGVALIFIIYGAPDLAITQLLVEVLVVVLFAVAALRLPLLPNRRESPSRPFDAILAIAIGGMVTLLLLGVISGPIDRRLTDFYETAAYTEAHGRNIVNVILVDFRALDTFGEIAVVVMAALAAVALLRQNGDKA
jgi:multicomponent Na+:H+ antiporter subunit A